MYSNYGDWRDSFLGPFDKSTWNFHPSKRNSEGDGERESSEIALKNASPGANEVAVISDITQAMILSCAYYIEVIGLRFSGYL